MFTGIVQAMGTVVSVTKTSDGLRLVMDPGDWDHAPSLGDSIAHNGCCLTLVAIEDGHWVYEAIPETIVKTTIGTWTPGQRINLERSLRMGDGLDGHQVQGHVDGVGTILSVDDADEYRIRIGIAGLNMKWMVPKGSICIDGVSLTLAAVNDDEQWVEVTLIPETLARTNLGDRTKADGVNIEGDVLVKTIVTTMERMQGISV
ncbi:MAG: riboflavin synthase [Phycisphaerales bacterium]|nr:riboflavin synthase [Phycisphaerales bacterium]